MTAVPGQFDEIDRDQELTSLKPEEVLGKLDLSGDGLEKAKAAADGGDEMGAFSALIDHYRAKFPLAQAGEAGRSFETADKICRHVIQWGPYEEADYGDEIDWEWDPAGDIEWVAAVCRFYWAGPLAEAYRHTRDEKYAQAFVDMTTDWIGKHTLEDRKRTHPVYTHWHGYVWLDIQTGIRATNICSAFKTLVHSKAVTPEFLRILFARLYDHQVKTLLIPMGKVHNKAVFEQRGFINVAYHFSEFTESRFWMEVALERARESYLLQTTRDGVQREWSFGYHSGVLRDAVEIEGRMKDFGIPFPADFKERIKLNYDYIFGVATPDLGAPMFGDGSRPIVNVRKDDRSTWPLYGSLKTATAETGDPKFAARADLDLANLPADASCAWPEAGMYAMRSDWGPDAVHMGLHCSPLAISGHDQPDNGTFELYAYGRWLMPDTGFYTYGHDAKGRAWHRQTSVHQTLTLDGKDIADDGRHLLWQSKADHDAVVVENGSYEGLTHRRSVWFVEKRFFVILDEAIGDLSGQLDLHFQFAPGDVAFDAEGLTARTQFDDANVVVVASEGAGLTLTEEEGWFAWGYGHRTPRKAFRFGHGGKAPAWFLTAVVPYKGGEMPDVTVNRTDGDGVGVGRVEAEVSVAGETWTVARDLSSGEATVEKR